MKLYHYTSIENLALILKSQKIRFTKLDCVDDVEESAMYNQISFGKYTFVSCWTKDKDENIALWKMYTPNGRGVRIEMDKDMFCRTDKNISKTQIGQMELVNGTNPILSNDEMINDNFMIMPFCNQENLFFRKIEYVSNPRKLVKNIIIEKNLSRTICFKRIGCYKHSKWEFQKECRFILHIYPFKKSDFTSPDAHLIIHNALQNEKELGFNYYDLALDHNKLKNISIRLGPLTTEAEEIIVKSLIDAYAKDAKIEKSDVKLRK